MSKNEIKHLISSDSFDSKFSLQYFQIVIENDNSF
jgi:hypothetical protein